MLKLNIVAAVLSTVFLNQMAIAHELIVGDISKRLNVSFEDDIELKQSRPGGQLFYDSAPLGRINLNGQEVECRATASRPDTGFDLSSGPRPRVNSVNFYRGQHAGQEDGSSYVVQGGSPASFSDGTSRAWVSTYYFSDDYNGDDYSAGSRSVWFGITAYPVNPEEKYIKTHMTTQQLEECMGRKVRIRVNPTLTESLKNFFSFGKQERREKESNKPIKQFNDGGSSGSESEDHPQEVVINTRTQNSSQAD